MEYSEEYVYNFDHKKGSFLLDFIAGSFAGLAVTLTGHPFDTLKVRMQNSGTGNSQNFISGNKNNKKKNILNKIDLNPKSSLIKEISKCLKNEGITGLYKGMSFPLFSVPLVNAVVFAVYELSRKIMNLEDECQMNLKQGVISGGISGFVNCIVVTPVELVKCRLQIQSRDKKKSFYKGVFDCIQKTFHEKGFRGLYTGNVATIFREVPAYAAQFGGYCHSKTIIAKIRKINQKDLSNFNVMTAGAIGGFSCWVFSYPQDVVKTQIQVGKIKICSDKRHYDGGFAYGVKKIYTENGFQGFWRGFSVCTMRALISNSVLFLSYENSKSILTKFLCNENKFS